MRKHVFAVGDIPYGARVLVRGCRASLPVNGVSNATACARPDWFNRREKIRNGGSMVAILDEPRTDMDLHAIANGPIMDSNMLYLPAGRISLAEAKTREASQILGDEA